LTPTLAARRTRSLALFGGSFDPIHAGHIAVARAARRRFHLDAIHFVPAGRPPHKLGHEMAAYPHRYAMVALACAGKGAFVPSAFEAGADFSGSETFYSIDVVRRFRKKMRAGERLYFLIGADAFLEIGTWREPEALLDACDFIIASRPGIDLGKLRRAIPPALLREEAPAKRGGQRGGIALRKTMVHLLDSVSVPVSSTEIRRRVARGQSIRGLVPAAVEDYICKAAIYR
jgi:nicotinate-nucleotide adenylyltransferase